VRSRLPHSTGALTAGGAAVAINKTSQLIGSGGSPEPPWPSRVADVHRGRERLSVARSRRQAGTSPWNVGRRCPLTMPRSHRTRHLIVDDFTLLVEDLRVRRSNRHACRRNPRLRDVGRSANLSRRNHGEGGSPTRRAVAAAKADRLLATASCHAGASREGGSVRANADQPSEPIRSRPRFCLSSLCPAIVLA